MPQNDPCVDARRSGLLKQLASIVAAYAAKNPSLAGLAQWLNTVTAQGNAATVGPAAAPPALTALLCFPSPRPPGRWHAPSFARSSLRLAGQAVT